MSDKEHGKTDYGECQHCGEYAVHLCKSSHLEFVGDPDTDNNEPSEYGGKDVYTDLSVWAYICFECKEPQSLETLVEDNYVFQEGDRVRVLSDSIYPGGKE